MSSRDGLMTPNSGFTEENSDRGLSITNFRPLYPGRRSSGMPIDTDIDTPIEPIARVKTATVAPIRTSEMKDVNSKSIMIDHNDLSKSLPNLKQRNNTEDLGSDESGDEEIIPEDERWKQRKCFWQMNAQIRIKWDLFVMVLATWN